MQLRYLEAWENSFVEKKCGVTNPAEHFSNWKRLNPCIGVSELYEFSQSTYFVAPKLWNVWSGKREQKASHEVCWKPSRKSATFGGAVSGEKVLSNFQGEMQFVRNCFFLSSVFKL